MAASPLASLELGVKGKGKEKTTPRDPELNNNTSFLSQDDSNDHRPSSETEISVNNNTTTTNEEITTTTTPTDPSLEFDFPCMVCHWGAQVLVDYQRKGKTIKEFLSVVSTLCHLVGIETKVW